MKPLNPYQPIRPSVDPHNGKPYFYRVHPIIGEKKTIYNTCDIKNRIAQILLYRWVRNDEEFVIQASCDELYQFLHNKIDTMENIAYFSKSNIGRTLLNAVAYDPRKLKGITKENDKVCQTYVIRDRLEMQYGLEYMICAWLRKFLKHVSSSAEDRAKLDEPESLGPELEMLNNAEDDELLSIYIDPQYESFRGCEEPDWIALTEGRGDNHTLPNKETYSKIRDLATERKKRLHEWHRNKINPSP